jgi:hypothetical protein
MGSICNQAKIQNRGVKSHMGQMRVFKRKILQFAGQMGQIGVFDMTHLTYLTFLSMAGIRKDGCPIISQ